MIKIEKTEVHGFEPAIRGMRNPMNSWDKSDSYSCVIQWIEDEEFRKAVCKDCAANEQDKECYCVGEKDRDLMLKLAKASPADAKYRRMIIVYADITAPLYWWKEFDTYKVGTVANSCSTMHKIHAKEFELDDFSHEHLYPVELELLKLVIRTLNTNRELFSEEKEKSYWWQMIQLLPSSYNQRRTVMLNYEVLSNIYRGRKDHKLDEWRELCKWIETLPCSEIITA